MRTPVGGKLQESGIENIRRRQLERLNELIAVARVMPFYEARYAKVPKTLRIA